MSPIRPLYLLSSSAPGADADVDPRGIFAETEPVRLTRADEMRGLTPGVLLLPAALPAAQILAALREAASSPAESAWLLVLVEPSPEGTPRLVPLSLGWPTPAAEIARWASGDREADVLELRHVLGRIARSRHDLNNPLTSAMAEAQLALMDVQQPEVRDGLQTIEDQLKRIRDLVAALRHLRAPDPRRS
jgi:signal transduction histidine kinase